MWHGIQIIERLTKGLEKYLERKGYNSLVEIKGKALPSICGWSDLDLSVRLIARIDEERCNGCGICEKACASGAFQAIEMEEKMALVDSSKCVEDLKKAKIAYEHLILNLAAE